MCQDVLSIVRKWGFYLELFDNKENLGLLSDTALGSFSIIEESLRQDLTLSICRLSDLSRDRKGNRNLSLQTLVENCDNIEGLFKLLQDFLEACAPIEKYRNKRVGHNDLNVRLMPNDYIVPNIRKSQIEKIIQQSCAILKLINQHYSSSDIAFPSRIFGGAEDLIYWLKRGRNESNNLLPS
jgi:hypothetical protein